MGVLDKRNLKNFILVSRFIRIDQKGHTLKINVTQEDIDKGEAGISNSCPVALAIKRSYGELVRVTVGCTRIYISDIQKTKYKTCQTPLEVVNFMCDFDRQNPVEPFEFEINPNKS